MSIDLIKENGFILKKARSRHYCVKTMTDAGYTDDLTFLANTPVQAESLQQSLKQAVGGIGLDMNTN